MKREKKSETNKKQSEKSFWERFGDGCLEAVIELIFSLVLFGIGAVVLALFGKIDALDQWDGETVMLIGIVAICVIVAIVSTIVAAVKKKRNPTTKTKNLCAGEKTQMKKKLTGASFGILGDSYSTFKDYIPEGNRCYYPNTEKVDDVLQVKQTWWHLLMMKNNMQLLANDSYSGATVCTDHSLPAISAYTERVKRTFSGDIQPDFIFLFGGTNDNWLDKTIGQVQYGDWTEGDLKRTLPAFCYVLDYISKKNPNSTIVVPINTGLKPELHTGMLEAAAHYGAVTICLADIDKKSGHPSALGMQQIAQQIEEVLQ